MRRERMAGAIRSRRGRLPQIALPASQEERPLHFLGGARSFRQVWLLREQHPGTLSSRSRLHHRRLLESERTLRSPRLEAADRRMATAGRRMATTGWRLELAGRWMEASNEWMAATWSWMAAAGRR